MKLSIGSISLKSPVILAPMSGVSDVPFRRLVQSFGVGLVVSEMIASQAMIRHVRQTLKMIERDTLGGLLCVQLAGCDPKVMAEAARLNEGLGADLIDINMGCPVKKIVNGYAGSALMKDERRAFEIMEETVRAVKIPVTLKMRTGWDHNNRNAPKLAKMAEDCGIQMITIHGRTRSQLYTGRSDWEFIGLVKESVSIPVVGNGDVVSEEDAKSLLDQSHADGVMIGRGSYGRPWFLNQVGAFLSTGEKVPPPPLKARVDVMIEHFESLLSYYGHEPGSRIARKHMGWYSKSLPNSTEFRQKINETQTSFDMRRCIDDFFKNLV